jgi:hypothetical protein
MTVHMDIDTAQYFCEKIKKNVNSVAYGNLGYLFGDIDYNLSTNDILLIKYKKQNIIYRIDYIACENYKPIGLYNREQQLFISITDIDLYNKKRNKKYKYLANISQLERIKAAQVIQKYWRKFS